MTDKHTPGPWTARTGRANTTVYAGPAYAVAVGCCAADARLIAAAPELLRTLRLVEELSVNGLDHAHPRNSATISAIASAARAAIELATEG